MTLAVGWVLVIAISGAAVLVGVSMVVATLVRASSCCALTGRRRLSLRERYLHRELRSMTEHANFYRRIAEMLLLTHAARTPLDGFELSTSSLSNDAETPTV